ncbi:MAG: BA14K family protein, partial [Mesorhizobium sp.]
MKPLFSLSVRSGLLALGLLAGLTAPSVAGPIAKPVLPVPA